MWSNQVKDEEKKKKKKSEKNRSESWKNCWSEWKSVSFFLILSATHTLSLTAVHCMKGRRGGDNLLWMDWWGLLLVIKYESEFLIRQRPIDDSGPFCVCEWKSSSSSHLVTTGQDRWRQKLRIKLNYNLIPSLLSVSKRSATKNSLHNCQSKSRATNQLLHKRLLCY